MLIHGTCNPTGMDAHYNGVYLKKQDILDIVQSRELIDKPVLLEHEENAPVGRVISAWDYNGKLDIIVDVPADSLWGSVANACVATSRLKDFSLGYKVAMSHDDSSGRGLVGKKKIVEVSLVRKGARHDCHIHNYVKD